MTISFSQRTALQIMVTSAVTFAGAVSNIGGTLSLFCGFSVLSAFEILYWAWKMGRGLVGAN